MKHVIASQFVRAVFKHSLRCDWRLRPCTACYDSAATSSSLRPQASDFELKQTIFPPWSSRWILWHPNEHPIGMAMVSLGESSTSARPFARMGWAQTNLSLSVQAVAFISYTVANTPVSTTTVANTRAVTTILSCSPTVHAQTMDKKEPELALAAQQA